MATDEQISLVLELEHQLNVASDERALETVERLYAPEFTLNSPAGRIQSRQETIDLLRTRPLMRQTDVRRTIEAAYSSGDVVVIMGYESLVWEGTGTEVDGQRSARRFTNVWRCVDGEWLRIARQATTVPVNEP